ncbi:hypothetical protein RIR_jg21295.t1 [Rhizophagus irregularis DAOM 181602=DAOM 197198]|nr:hypothetical protein RIR_jg21295.t1 [Rhizophagus irregularis DAOM 181602=DAOM 197198]
MIKEQHYFDNEQLKNFEAVIEEKDIEIKKVDQNSRHQKVDLKKNAKKAKENGQFHEFFNIIFDDNTNNDLDLEIKNKPVFFLYELLNNFFNFTQLHYGGFKLYELAVYSTDG